MTWSKNTTEGKFWITDDGNENELLEKVFRKYLDD